MSDPIITADLVTLDADLGATKDSVITALAARLTEAGRAGDASALTAAALAREAQSATGLPGGIAIPHCRAETVTAASLGFARLAPKVDFGAPDGPADLVFLIAAPEGAGAEHMKLLSSLARALVRPEFVSQLRAAAVPSEIVALVEGVIAPAPAPAQAAAPVAEPAEKAATTTTPATERTVVAVTACPTGIAHTYMAADSLVAAGSRAGVKVLVETQGSSGSTPLPADAIASADAVVFATDVGVRGRERFAGKPVIESGVKRAINEPDAMIAEAVRASENPSAAKVSGDAPAEGEEGAETLGWGTRLRQVLLTGVSYMIPFVAAGGLLIALGFLLGGYEISESAGTIVLDNSLTELPAGGLATYFGAVLFQLGSLAFGFLVPALAGYIAFAIADRPGLAPGFTAGAVAVFVGAGFLGGLVGGLIAGITALWIARRPVPQWARGLMPVVVVPLFASLIVGVIMFALLGKPLAAVTSGLTDWLNGLSGTSAVALGVILGLMMCFDLGGPVNKAAYAFAVAGLSVTDPATLKIMAAVMAAGMVPPLAMALSTLLRPKLYTPAERENGKAAWLLGASFISEGAIPFAAADPLRVIPSMMAGGAVTGALIMATGTTLSAPHGGIFVFFAVGGIAWFVLALAAGTLVGALCVTAAKEFAKPRPVAQPALTTV
ncbi:PTS fructose transporter subunit IIABC [Nocardia puris]|uniref:PTS system D-fructose-specific IIA component (F1P-forming) (Frc family) /PTS system D-fructose-specific IIB component (F1P-forming) (Frc family) /PTS system D-fructose-specific IIC component (F1P-f... n=1 Tax=Nocardia puris TaxID=208602 RepID=A0A366DWE1_9NOCA|nr:fructose-specific PTS transporter subunit EIIC [Nocardia puris]RBO93594.1 PTS system D-fructose-specific IIA component (F1P-forming) (Frc family) /PTS system D-fructose-specific IIB component (F1P-forming) (Frc family) /PTS system D-fructose-specific IIC component (F1P-forming) (Frc family) [Nocardia puris]